MSLDEGQTHNCCGYKGCTHCHCHWCHFASFCELDQAQDKISALLDEVRRLREALALHGKHLPGCHYSSGLYGIKPSPCTCGLDAALSS